MVKQILFEAHVGNIIKNIVWIHSEMYRYFLFQKLLYSTFDANRFAKYETK